MSTWFLPFFRGRTGVKKRNRVGDAVPFPLAALEGFAKNSHC